MSDHSTVHPDLRASLKLTPRIRLRRSTLWFFRAALRVFPARPSVPREVAIHETVIEHGERRTKLRLRVYRPRTSTAAAPALLWIHGGGYVMGRPEMDDWRCIEYVRALGLVVVSVRYRLAPQHPFPAALDDCWAAFGWIHAQAAQLGIDRARVAVGGASAGGGLAAALAQLASDRKTACRFQLLVYPMLDDRTSQHAGDGDDEHFVWTKRSNRFGWTAYLGADHSERGVPAYAVPARRRELAGLPPAWIGVGTADLFHDENVTYARRLEESGVECELHSVSGAYHGFDVAFSRPALVRRFRDAQLAALRKHLVSAVADGSNTTRGPVEAR